MIAVNQRQKMISKQQFVLLTAVLLLAVLVTADDTPLVANLPDDTGQRVPLQTVVPVYPEKARRARVEGEVEVCFNVNREGKTSRVAVRRSTNRVFEKASRDAVRRSTYLPLPADKELSGIKTCRTFRFFLSSVAVETPGS